MSDHYGLEIQNISSVYVNVDDLAPEEIFSLPEEKVKELEEMAESLLEALRSERQVDDIKRAAVLYDHLMLLMRYNKVDARRFEQAAKELEQMLDQVLNKPKASQDEVSISDLERMQLRNMLDLASFNNKLSLAVLLRMFWLKIRCALQRRRQLRSFNKIMRRRKVR